MIFLLKTYSQCPVCNKDVIGDNVALNLHIDECLNQSAIEEISIDPANVSSCSTTGNKSFEMLQQPSTSKSSTSRYAIIIVTKLKLWITLYGTISIVIAFIIFLYIQ